LQRGRFGTLVCRRVHGLASERRWDRAHQARCIRKLSGFAGRRTTLGSGLVPNLDTFL